MANARMLSIDLAKRSFQFCATDRAGSALYNRTISRSKLEALLREEPRCIVAMEACATSHFWGRFAGAEGHEARLIPPIYIKPFVKMQKNDAADAAAIAEAAVRPNLHFVAVKSAEHQARAVAYRTHQCFVSQGTPTINALRGHLAEFGLIFSQGVPHLKEIRTAMADDDVDVPLSIREIAGLYLEHIETLTAKIDELSLRLREAMAVSAELCHLCTMPGVGPVTAGVIMTFEPDLRTFDSGRNFAAWLGLVPKQRSTGGKSRVGSMSNMGQSDIRKLLVVGALSRIRWIVRRGVLPDNWLGRMMARRPRMVVAVALANKWRGQSGR